MFSKYVTDEEILQRFKLMIPDKVIEVYEEAEGLKKKCRNSIVEEQLNNLQLICIYCLGENVIQCNE